MTAPPNPRVIFIGDSGVEKTTLIHYAKNHVFNDNPTSTIGAGITEIEAEVDGKMFEFQFWDTAGQEIYRNIVPIYFRGAVGAILTFSMGERQSFLNLNDWAEQLLSHTSENVDVIVCGNKTDLEEFAVDHAEAEKWANDRRYSILFTSARTGENVDALVELVVRRFLAPGNVQFQDFNTGQGAGGRKKCC
jgi:small GTP-binding protein